MSSSHTRLALTLALAVVLSISTAVTASATSLTFIGEGKSALVEIQSPELGALYTYAGELEWTWVGTPPAGFSNPFYSYCIDADDFLTSPQSVTIKQVDSLDAADDPDVVGDAGEKVAWLYDTYASDIQLTGTDTDAAALQVAIWAALYTDTDSITAGPFKLLSGGTVGTDAQAYLDALYGAGSSQWAQFDATWLDAPAGAGQDQMLGTPVPEPISALLLGSGLLLSGGLAKRRWRARRL